MRKFLHSPLFRRLVVLLLVCSILVNVSPLKANASAIVIGSAITGAGVFATLFAISMGIVFVDLTADLINGLGDSFVDHVTESTSTDDETEIFKVWVEPLQVDLDSGGISQLPPDDDTNPWGALAGLFTLPDELKDNFLNWGKDLINRETEVVLEEEVTADEGYIFFDNILYPEFPSSCNSYAYTTIYNDNGNVVFLKHQYPYKLSSDSLFGDYYEPSNSSPGCEHFLDASGWGTHNGIGRIGLIGEYFGSTIISTNYDLVGDDGSVERSASSPTSTSTTTVPVLPDTYVGDIPQKIQNDEFDDDDFALPYINPTKIWENQTDAIEALNNTATQLQNQTMTYDQYMEQIQTPTGGNTGTGSNPGNTTDPDVSDELSDYTFDLRDIFPFCIPFDLYDFFACLDAPPEAPVINWEIYLPGGGVCPITLDLSCFDEVAQLLRRLELLLFCVGLAFKTRDLIKG